MTNYLIRRGFQMILVVILATIAIYLLLNAVPGGPLSGLNHHSQTPKTGSANKTSLASKPHLGLNKPTYLAYLTWMFGEDWLDEVGDMIGNPGPADKMFETGTWRDFQSPTCQDAGGTNANATGERHHALQSRGGALGLG